LRHIGYEDIEYAHVDHHRSLRKGFPEVIFGQGKTADQVIGIMNKMKDQESIILVTRLEQNKADEVVARFPNAVYHPDAEMIWPWDHLHHFSRHVGHTGCRRSILDG
jgi:NCAIR mutase (PurE)-related protein